LHVGLPVSSTFSGNFSSVRPPSRRFAAITYDAIASAVSFRDRMVAKIIEMRKVLPCASRCIQEIESTAVACDGMHNLVIRFALSWNQIQKICLN